MITYEQAKEIALSKNKRVNTCHEYKDGYLFFEKTDIEIDGDCGVVVLKETGRAIHFTSFILNYSPERNPKIIEF